MYTDSSRPKMGARENRVFAFTFAGALIVVGLVALQKGRNSLASVVFLVAAASSLAGTLAPAKLGPFRAVWTKIGDLIAGFTTPVVLAALYFLVLTPPAVLQRSRRKRARTSGWVKRDPLPAPSQMERQF